MRKKISDFLWRFFLPLRRFFQSVKNLFIWLPIIWYDRQWDYHYLYEILYKKILLMEEFFASDQACSQESNATSKQMTEVRKALERLIEDNYHDDSEMESLYGKILMEYKDCPTYPGHVEWEIRREREYTEEDREKMWKLMKKAQEKEEWAIKADLNVVFFTMKQHIREWWD